MLFIRMIQINPFHFVDITRVLDPVNVVVVKKDGGVGYVYFFPFSSENNEFGFLNVDRHFVAAKPVREFLNFDVHEFNKIW